MEKDYIFYGLFLKDEDRNLLINFISNNKSLPHVDNFILEHCTLLHYSQEENNTNIKTFCECCIDTEFVLKIVAIGVSDKVMAFKVEIPGISCANKNPHITICTFKNGKPVDSNKINNFQYCIEPIELNVILKKI